MAKCSNIIKVLNVIGKYKDLDQEWLEGQHDMILFPLMETDDISADDKKELESLGCHLEDGGWMMYT